ncbi:MAG: glycoside hydrolase family 3 N-terminal domain-containing protein [Pseudomonadota bacterium]
MTPPISAVFGCSAGQLSDWERGFFREMKPWGYIVFGRNIETADQLRRFTDDLRAASDDEEALVFVDQEGGSVARLKGPEFRHPPAPRAFADLFSTDPETAAEATWLNARLMADELRAVGITANCAPMVDVVTARTHTFLQSRALGLTPEAAGTLGAAAALGLRDGRVVPVIKHAPGHGRATADSHHDLPVVDAALSELEATDFQPFKRLIREPMMMIAHIVYKAMDPERPATTSQHIISELVRSDWGYDGLLITDDLNMKALGGTMEERCRAALEAGMEILCHCNGERADMEAVARAAVPLSGKTLERADAARRLAQGTPKPFERDAAIERLNSLSLYETPAS